MKRMVMLFLAFVLLIGISEPLSAGRQKRSKSSSKEKTQQVSGYTSKSGKHVKPYKRRPPN